MKVGSFLLCRSAVMRPDGSFDIEQSDLAESVESVFPAQLRLAAVLVLEAEPGERGPQRLEISLRDAHATPLRRWPFSFALKEGQRGARLVLNLKEAEVPAPGEYLVVLKVNGRPVSPAKTFKALGAA